MLELTEVKNYLKIEDDSDDKLLGELITLSEEYVLDALNITREQFTHETINKRLEMFQMLIIQDLYDERTNMGGDRKQRRLIIESIYRQLSLSTPPKLELKPEVGDSLGYGKTE